MRQDHARDAESQSHQTQVTPFTASDVEEAREVLLHLADGHKAEGPMRLMAAMLACYAHDLDGREKLQKQLHETRAAYLKEHGKDSK